MPKTVLVIEDDEDTREIYARALSHRGYEVLMAKQGAEGVHLARTRAPDLVLLDIRMPVMDGWQAIRYLRSYLETRRIPVCAISAFAPDDEVLEELGTPFDCFLTKPLDPKVVVAEIEARIGAPDAVTPSSEDRAQ
jgi:CheY-like chemotaxis protein